MLDSSTVRLGSTYKRYKLGTTKLKDWLRDTAFKVVQSGETQHKAEIHDTADYRRLAEAISKTRPKVTVPITIFLCIRDVIRGRTECATFFQQLEDTGAETGEALVRTNQGHRHFITVLEDVQALLNGLEVEHSAKTSVRPSKTDAIARRKPTFDTLELEEPSPALADDSPIVPSEPSEHGNGDPVTQDPSLDERESVEESFAIFCAFQDMRQIRLRMQLVWEKYFEGQLSYLVANEMTSSAFYMIRDIGRSLKDACWWIESFDDITSHLCLESCSTGYEPILFVNDLKKILPESDLHDAHGNIVKPAELFCAPAHAVLNDFRMHCRAGRELINENFQVRVSSHPLANMLREVEPTLRFMADQMESGDIDASRLHGFFVDPMTESLILTSKFGIFPVWAVAACQILMDILDALGMNPQVGYDILQASVAQGSYSARVEQSSSDESQKAKAMMTLFKDLTEGSKEVEHEHGRSEGRPRELTGTYAWPADRHPRSLLPALPLLSGFRLKLLAFGHCIQSVQAANQNLGLLGIAYAYRAARAFGLIDGAWADMDTIIHSQAIHGPYVLEASNMKGYTRHFDIAIGVSPAKFSSDSGRGAHQAQITVPSASKIAAKMKKLRTPPGYLLSVLETGNKAGGLTYEQFYQCLYRNAQQVYNMNRQVSLTPLELLSGLEKGLIDDEVHLKFDYDKLSIKCHALLSTASRTASDTIAVEQAYSAASVGGAKNKLSGDQGKLLSAQRNNTEIAELIHAALWEAADMEREGATPRMKARSKLGQIANLIQQAMSFEPDAFLSTAQQGSSGYIPDSEAPYRRWRWGGKALVSFGPITPEEHIWREKQCKVVNIQNAGCAEHRRLQSLKGSTSDNIARVKQFVNQKLIEAGMPELKAGTVKLVPEYRFIAIEIWM